MRFFRSCIFQKKSEEFKECEKEDFSNSLFFKFSEKRKTRRKRKHKGTFLSQKDQHGRNTVFVKTETVTKGSKTKHIVFFCEEGRVRRGEKTMIKPNRETKKKEINKRDQQRKTFKNENTKEKCLKTHKNKTKEGKIAKRRTNMQKQIQMKKCTKKKRNEQTSFFS